MFNQNEGHRRLSMPTSCQNIDLDICSMSLLVLTQVRHTNIKKKSYIFFILIKINDSAVLACQHRVKMSISIFFTC